MAFRLPSTEEVSDLEQLANALPKLDDTYRPIDPNLRSYTYTTTPLYGEWVFTQSRRPVIRDVPSTVIGANTLGLCFPEGNGEIWLNSDERYGGMTRGFTKKHEENHAHTPRYDFGNPSQTEAQNRWRTYRETGDSTQLHGYYP